MMCKSFATLLKTGSVSFLLFALLFAGGSLQSSSNFIGTALRGITAVLRDSETQWMVFVCLGIYFTVFCFLRSHSDAIPVGRASPQAGSLAASPHHRFYFIPAFWLGCTMFISAILYTIHYSPSTPALTLLAGAVIGQAFAIWVDFEARSQKSGVGISFEILVVYLLVVSLALVSTWPSYTGSFYFKYHSHARWSGPWDNPNIFGLLMGTGVALALGLAVGGWKMEDGRSEMENRSWKLRVGKYAVVILCFFALVLMGRGLLHSYSRGAWLATFCGTAYLMGSRFWVLGSGGTPETSQVLNPSILNSQPSTATPNWFHRNVLPLTAIVFCVGILSFWHFRQTDWHPAHRAFSVGNQNDFSWRNRLSAWEGALQITAEHPWFGSGWNQPEPMYERYYLPPKSTESAAIQMNDYLLLGATLGIPALFCFGMYLWRSLMRNAECRVLNSGNGNSLEARPALGADWMRITCHAGAIVLLVGFWFDGGLFKLATASIFWILLELGSTGNHEIHEPHEND
jgi:O-Antigen ligase